MPRKYEKEKTQRVKERNKIEDNKKRMPISDEVICVSCKEPSGWANDVLMYVTGDRELKCKKCGEVCVRVLAKKNSLDIVRDAPIEVKRQSDERKE